jgi:type VI secretion system protein ImpC
MANESSKSTAPATGATKQVDDFERLLAGNVVPNRQKQVLDGVQELAKQALANTQLVSEDALETMDAMIAELDRRISEQVNLILHHEDFKLLEGSWRGLHRLVSKTETDAMLEIRVLHVSKKELSATFRRYKDANWDQSPIYKKIYGEEYDTAGGKPYGCLVGDYFFDHAAPDINILRGMAQIGAVSHCPFITGAAPGLLGMKSWQELNDPPDITKIFESTASVEYAAWRSLRESEDSRFLGLAMPRVLARLPYGARSNPVADFNFEEKAEGRNDANFVWSNAAYALGENIARAFKKYGWCSQIRGRESGGSIEDLPCHTFPTDDGGVDLKCPTEIAIGDRREAELAKNGLMPLLHYKNTDYAVFIGAQSLQKPTKYFDKDAMASANLSARLPYLFAACRFAHYLKCMVRDKIGSNMERPQLEAWLNEWIQNYVVDNPEDAGDQTRAERPLAEAKAVVEEVEGNPGYYTARFLLRPHYQLESLNVSLRLVARVHSGKT